MIKLEKIFKKTIDERNTRYYSINISVEYNEAPRGKIININCSSDKERKVKSIFSNKTKIKVGKDDYKWHGSKYFTVEDIDVMDKIKEAIVQKMIEEGVDGMERDSKDIDLEKMVADMISRIATRANK